MTLIWWNSEFCGSKPDATDKNCPNCGAPRQGDVEVIHQEPDFRMLACTTTNFSYGRMNLAARTVAWTPGSGTDW